MIAGYGRSNPEVVGSIPTEVKRFFSWPWLRGTTFKGPKCSLYRGHN